MASVSFSRIEKSFGATKVLHGISMDIADGEFMVLVGPSGCGKSTLLRMLAGLEEISAGTIAIDSKVVNEVESKDRDIAMVFQSYALYPHMTVADNMAFSLKLRKADASVIQERVSRAAKILNLEPYLARFPRELSGGQRQRVAMGRAIVRDPKVFLFDEPLSNLTPSCARRARRDQALHQRLKTTTVRDPRPDRGDDSRPHRGDERRPHAAQQAARALRPADEPVRCPVHRLSVDVFDGSTERPLALGAVGRSSRKALKANREVRHPAGALRLRQRHRCRSGGRADGRGDGAR
jgi:ABC-type nitrate/sulfonate/bicarbonate transport system ATPase subunit